MPSGPNLDLHSVFTNILRAKDMKISRHMGIGDIETHPGRPRYFWGIGSRLGHPSKYQNRPRARRNHITASLAMFHTPTYDHMGEIPPSFGDITQKQNAHGRGGVLAWGGGLGNCFLHTRDPHSPSCGHFHKHFQKTQFFAKHGDEGQTG